VHDMLDGNVGLGFVQIRSMGGKSSLEEAQDDYGKAWLRTSASVVA